MQVEHVWEEKQKFCFGHLEFAMPLSRDVKKIVEYLNLFRRECQVRGIILRIISMKAYRLEIGCNHIGSECGKRSQ